MTVSSVSSLNIQSYQYAGTINQSTGTDRNGFAVSSASGGHQNGKAFYQSVLKSVGEPGY